MRKEKRKAGWCAWGDKGWADQKKHHLGLLVSHPKTEESKRMNRGPLAFQGLEEGPIGVKNRLPEAVKTFLENKRDVVVQRVKRRSGGMF